MLKRTPVASFDVQEGVTGSALQEEIMRHLKTIAGHTCKHDAETRPDVPITFHQTLNKNRGPSSPQKSIGF
jgi:hypothetical protein